jgi:transglutaminase-like putative cysteine protease
MCFVFFAASFVAGCSSGSGSSAGSVNSGSSSVSSGTKRTTLSAFVLPSADGITTYGTDTVSIDASHTDDGYVMVSYQGAAEKAKLQITVPDQTVYTYTLAPGDYSSFPLSGNNGSYQLDVLECAYENMYALVFSQTIQVALKDEFGPFLYPNQYVWYTSNSQAVKLGMEISDGSSDDLNYVENVYDYVINNITYDQEIASNIPLDYIPDIDATLASSKGICFDYAALMAAMLRSQGIPTKLEVGYSGTAYHSWISVYLAETGWVDNIIEFDGKSWSLMDPTLAANNSSKAVQKYIGDGSNYTLKYLY